MRQAALMSQTFTRTLMALALFVGLSLPLQASERGPRQVRPVDVYALIPEKDDLGRDQRPMFREWNPDPVANHAANLRALNPRLAAVVTKAQAAHPDLSFVIGSGRRDAALQGKAMAWGWSRRADSKHQTGDAVDLWPLDREGRVHFDPTALNRVARAMKRAAAALGVEIRWGGQFTGYKRQDRSHFELAQDEAGPQGSCQRSVMPNGRCRMANVQEGGQAVLRGDVRAQGGSESSRRRSDVR